MSEALIKGCGPTPASALKAPPFTGTGLPLSTEKVSSNILKQKRDERRAGSRLAVAAAKNGDAAPAPCCKTLHISLCFDGTNNHEPSDKGDPLCTSNVARLYHASIDKPEDGYLRYYSPGVGTVFEEIKEYEPNGYGLIGAQGGENRINWGLTRLISALQWTLTQAALEPPQTQALVEAMSTTWATNVLSGGLLENGAHKREAAMRPEEQKLRTLLEQRQANEEKPEILALRLYVYGFSRGAAQARTFANWLAELTRNQGDKGAEYRFAGLPISIEFLGLFDTVAAVGLADSAPFAAGHMSWADDTMRLPDEESIQACMPTELPDDRHFLKRCVHLVSAHEQRASFPLDSIRRREKTADGKRNNQLPSRYRAGTREYFYPGMHSDVGGGYPAKDQGKAMGGSGELLSQVPLHHMYREAFFTGAPLQVPETVIGEHEPWRQMDESTRNEFDFTPELIDRFNAWQAQAKDGPLEDVIERETALITGWRIDRYAGGIEKTSFYAAVRTGDESEEVWEAKTRLHAHRHTEMARMRSGKGLVPCAERIAAGRPRAEGDCPGYTGTETWALLSPTKRFSFEEDIQLVGLEKYQALNTNKAYEPTLDARQLRAAAAEFEQDYKRTWGVTEDTLSLGGIINILLGGTVFLINEEDEAEEYAKIHTQGTACYNQLFVAPGVPAPGKELLVKLFDEQVHDSRAWFMNSSGLGEREPFTDYFRFRLAHFDNESNKSLSVLATAGRVVGVGIALASVGLSIKKRNPRYLLGLFLPSLATPVLTGKVGMPQLPEVSAFDPLTGIALPMLQGVDALRAFTRQPGDIVSLLNAMPLPEPLTENTANTPELKAIFQAAEAAKALQEAKESKDVGGLLGQAMTALEDANTKPSAGKSGWLDKVADVIQEEIS